MALVGITVYSEDARWGAWDRRAALVPFTYIDTVTKAGGRPVLLPPGDPTTAVDAIDALILIGGGDIDPEWSGAGAHPSIGGVDSARDEAEEALLKDALDRDLPVLAICRGMQLLNVHLGGTLMAHLPDTVGHEGHRQAPGTFGDIEIEATGRTAQIFGEHPTVTCSHHQAIDTLAQGLVVTARAITDGTIEAVEMSDRTFVLGVQWHPEEVGDTRPVAALLQAVKGR